MYKNDYLENCIKNNEGSSYLIWGYEYTRRNNFNELAIGDLGFIYGNEKKLKQFKDELVKSGIREFILTESSSSLMDILHALDSVNIRIGGVTEVKYINRITGEQEYMKGLKMIVD